jgi:hypothetical protein
MVMNMMTGQGAPGPPPGELAGMLGMGGQPPPQPGNPPEIVQQMLDLAKQYLDVEPDHEDKLAMQKVTTQLQQLLAKDQADADGALSGNTNPRTLRKALGA